MALGMGSVNNATELIALAGGRPGIRIVSPQYSAQNLTQAQWVTEYSINWTSASDANGQMVAGFSAVCYLTAAEVYDAYNGTLPLGLIDTSVGGTMIELWLPPAKVEQRRAGVPGNNAARTAR